MQTRRNATEIAVPTLPAKAILGASVATNVQQNVHTDRGKRTSADSDAPQNTFAKLSRGNSDEILDFEDDSKKRSEGKKRPYEDEDSSTKDVNHQSRPLRRYVSKPHLVY